MEDILNVYQKNASKQMNKRRKSIYKRSVKEELEIEKYQVKSFGIKTLIREIKS